MFDYSLPCPVAHAGFCRSSPLFEQALFRCTILVCAFSCSYRCARCLSALQATEISKRFQKFILENRVGAVVEVCFAYDQALPSAQPIDEILTRIYTVSHCRYSNPKMALLLEHRSGALKYRRSKELYSSCRCPQHNVKLTRLRKRIPFVSFVLQCAQLP